MLIKFSEEFLKYTSGVNEVDISAYTLGDSLEKLFNRFPQLLVFLLERNGEEADKTSFKFNGEYIYDPTEIGRLVNSEDVLEFGRDIPVGENAIGRIVAGVAILALAWWNPLGWSAATALMVGAMGASTAIGGLAELVMGQPSLPSYDNANSSSATYTFSGIRNTTTAGTPVSIVYGTHRVGGHIINVYDELVGTNNYLRAQIGLCEGEIAELYLDEIEVNNRRLAEFPDDELTVLARYGTSDQSQGVSLRIPEADTTTVTITSPYRFSSEGASWEHVLESAGISGAKFKFNFDVPHRQPYEQRDQNVSLFNLRVYYKDSTDVADYVNFQDFVGTYNTATMLGFGAVHYEISFSLTGLPRIVNPYKVKMVLTWVNTISRGSGGGGGAGDGGGGDGGGDGGGGGDSGGGGTA